jgi:integrase
MTEDNEQPLEQSAVLKPTVATWCEEYKAHHWPKFAQATKNIVNRELVRFALYVGRREISGRILHEYMDEQRRRSSGETLAKTVRWTSSFLRWAEEMGYLDRRYSSLGIFKGSSVFIARKTPLRFSTEQYEALKEATKGTVWYYASVMAYRTGARMSDVCLLKWESVHLEELYIHYLPWKSRKSQRYATCPFQAGGDFHNVLLELNASRDKRPHWDQYVCAELAMRYPVNCHGYGNQTLSKHFQAFCHQIGVPHLTFHKLRNAFMSRTVNSGVPFAQARQITGLGSDSILMRYARPDVATLRAAIEKIEANDNLPPPAAGTILSLPAA